MRKNHTNHRSFLCKSKKLKRKRGNGERGRKSKWGEDGTLRDSSPLDKFTARHAQYLTLGMAFAVKCFGLGL